MAILTSILRVRLGRGPSHIELMPNRAVAVDDERVEALLDSGHALGRKLIEAGVLKVTRDPAVTRTTEATGFAPPPDLTELSIAKAAPHIAHESDLDRLARWRERDDRAGIHSLIDKRVEALVAPSEES